MSTDVSTATNTSHHSEHLADRAAMLAMRTVIALQPKADLGPAGRAAFDELMEKTPSAEGITYEAASVGGVPGWWCRPAEAEVGPAILYLHGGAYVVGSARAYRHLAGQIASRANAPAFVTDYGLAPERPFPAAVEDAEAAYRGLADAGFSRIAVAGDSAGGGLALVMVGRMTRVARDHAAPRPVAVCVISPWTDLALTGGSIESRAKHDPLLSRDALEVARQLYLGQADAKDPRASPMYGEPTGLPPILLHVGEDEILLDDAQRYADLLAKSGSAAELHIWHGMTHVFPANLALLKAAGEALDIAGEFLRRHFARSTTLREFPINPTKMETPMTKILFVGQKPETVDFSDPSLPPGFNAEKINAGIALGVKKIEEHGWKGDTCMITPDAAGSAMLEKALTAANYDCVVIGGGMRLPPKGLVLFETVVNIIHKSAPNATIAFNTRPEDTADAAARQLKVA
jgi:epsilon-lactone hydrolase